MREQPFHFTMVDEKGRNCGVFTAYETPAAGDELCIPDHHDATYKVLRRWFRIGRDEPRLVVKRIK